MNDLLEHFIDETRELVQSGTEDLLALEAAPGDAKAVNRVFRVFHTLKGSVGLFDFPPWFALLHAAEDGLSAARSGTLAVDARLIDLSLETLDATTRWVDAVEATERLPATAANEAADLAGRYRSLIGCAPAAPPADTAAVPDWASRLTDSMTAFAGTPLTAVRYRPRDDCYFSGDDPLGLVRKVSGLRAVAVEPASPWDRSEDFDAYACNLVVTLLTDAPRAEVESVFRLVGDQVTLVEMPAIDAPAPTDGLGATAALPHAVAAILPEQVRVPAAEGDGAIDAGRTLRVDAGRVDALVALVGELVVARNALGHIAARAEAGADAVTLARAIRDADAHIGRLATTLHRNAVSLRLTPLSQVFRRFGRPVREAARRLGKAVVLDVEGEETQADRGIVENLFEPLLHVVRNAVDHGLEDAPTRRGAGKPAAGRIRMAAGQDGDGIVVSVSDDGGGIDPAFIRRRAVERGLRTPEAAAALDDAALTDLIFAPGFSTARSVGALSGRGVGMDAVRAAAERMGGRVSVESEVGRGTTIRLHLPRTVALARLMVVGAGGEAYGIAMDAVVEVVRRPRTGIQAVGGGNATVLRGRTVPVFRLADLLGHGAVPAEAPEALLMTLRWGAQTVALEVERFDDRIEAVVRPPSGLVGAVPWVAGTTLLGDGRVLLVLDPTRLFADEPTIDRRPQEQR